MSVILMLILLYRKTITNMMNIYILYYLYTSFSAMFYPPLRPLLDFGLLPELKLSSWPKKQLNYTRIDVKLKIAHKNRIPYQMQILYLKSVRKVVPLGWNVEEGVVFKKMALPVTEDGSNGIG